MKIVIAPDSFKGSISAREICSCVKEGVLKVYPSATILELPLADGGEGTMENLVYATGGSLKTTEVKGPLGSAVAASIGVLGDGETVVIEMAQASGLPLLKEDERDPYRTTSYGTGELIKYALDMNYRKFIIGLGGSATNDAGAGALKALGMKFFDADGNELQDGGEALTRLSSYDDTNLDARIKDSSFIIASDVKNTLCGPKGASTTFGPQKGATLEQVVRLDGALNHFSKIVLNQKDIELREIVGGGAAGGLGATFVGFLGAEMKSGIEFIMDTIQFESSIQDADLIITGEGKLDAQTLSGKVISGVSKVAEKSKVPVIALCGEFQINGEQMEELGLFGVFTIVPGPCTLETAHVRAPDWIAERTEQIMRFMKSSRVIMN